MKQTSKLTGFLALAVFTVFALCILAVLLTGARVYRTQVDRAEESYEKRTAAQYVTTRVRQAETLTVEDFSGCQALTFSEDIAGKTYLTRIYLYDGYLRELYCTGDAALSPEDGEKVLELDSLSFSIEDGLLTAQVDGQTLVFVLERKSR